MISMERAHRAVPLTGGFCAAVAAHIPGTILHALARPGRPSGELRLATPSGVLTLVADVVPQGTNWHAASAGVFRTARRLMQGQVAVPEAAFAK